MDVPHVARRKVDLRFASAGQDSQHQGSCLQYVDHIDAPDENTVIFRMKEPNATLLWNLSDGAMGIVPYGSGDEITLHPIGSGPFKFVSAETDREVVIERNDEYWGGAPKLARVRFAVVPDETTEALEFVKAAATSRSTRLLPTRWLRWSGIPISAWNTLAERGWPILDSICVIQF